MFSIFTNCNWMSTTCRYRKIRIRIIFVLPYFLDDNSEAGPGQVGREMPELVRLFVIVQLLCGYISDEVHSHNGRQRQVIGWSGHLYRMSCTSQWTLTKMFEGSTCGVSVRGGGRW